MAAIRADAELPQNKLGLCASEINPLMRKGVASPAVPVQQSREKAQDFDRHNQTSGRWATVVEASSVTKGATSSMQ